MTKRSDVNEETEIWREIREERQQRRAGRRDAGVTAIERLRDYGFGVEVLSEYQFRIDGKLDLYPTNGKFHHLPTQARGRYRNPYEIATRLLRPKERRG